MYPTLFRIGSFELTSFGVLVAAGSAVGLWLFKLELERSRLPANALDAALAGIIGGLVGAKVLWTAEHFGEAPLQSLLFSRGGLSWFGGFLGGLVDARAAQRADCARALSCDAGISRRTGDWPHWLFSRRG